MSVIRQNLTCGQFRMVLKKRNGENQKASAVILKEGFGAAIETVQIAFHEGEQAHVLLPAVRIGIEERIVGVQIDGGARQGRVPVKLFHDKGLQVVGTGAADIVLIVVPYKKKRPGAGKEQTE